MSDGAFDAACTTLKQWCEASHGQPIDIGHDAPLSFSSTQRSSARELDDFEREFGVRLPGAYRTFMSLVGASRLFVDIYDLGFIFPAVDELENYARSVFENAGENQFPGLVIICGLNHRGDFGAIDLELRDAPFSVFSSECPPDRWRSEGFGKMSFENWIVQLVATRGENDLP